MGFGEWFGVVGGIISIIAFLFSVWIWMKSDIEVRELRGVIQSSYDISGSILWEMTQVPGEDPAVRLRQAERSLGLVSAIHTVASKYADSGGSHRQHDLTQLLERGVIWSNAMISDLERSDRVKEVWLVSPDLEPDLSEAEAGVLVNKNIRRGVRYTYFVPSGLAEIDELRAKLIANLKLEKSPRWQNLVSVVSVDRGTGDSIFLRGNIIFYFEGDPAVAPMDVLEEVVLNKISRRGLLWQEYARPHAERLRRTLREELARAATT